MSTLITNSDQTQSQDPTDLTLAYVTPISGAGHGPPVLRKVPTALVEDAPSIWYQPQADGTMHTSLVTQQDPPDEDRVTQVELWKFNARQGNAIHDIGERKLSPEAADNQAVNRVGYSMDLEGYFEPPTDGSAFHQSVDYYRSYSADDW